MSLLPKQLPFDKIGLARAKSPEEIKKWLDQFINDFQMFYSRLYDQIENNGFETQNWKVKESDDGSKLGFFHSSAPDTSKGSFKV
jgi:hypothetical protein